MQFELKVISSQQDISMLVLNAGTMLEAINQAKNQGYIVLAAKEQSGKSSMLPKRSSKFPLLLFSHELLSLLNAGLSLIDTMETLREKEHRPNVKIVLNQIVGSLYEGITLSGSLEKSQNIFPPLYIALIRSSEKTGNLAEALQRYVDYQLQVDFVRKKVISASIYPAILVMVGSLVIMFLMLYVVPKFSVIYENKGDQLPWLSLALLAWGRMLNDHAWVVITSLIGFLALAVYGLTRKVVRQSLVDILWSIPAIGERMRIYQLSRFYRTLGMLLRGGIPVITAMQMVSGLLKPTFSGLLKLAEQDVREGVMISSAMESRGLTTPVAVRMMRVGEHTGQMGEMMERIGNFYDDEIARWIDWFTKLFEPILMVFIGLIIGVIVVLMYMPIFELAGSIQ